MKFQNFINKTIFIGISWCLPVSALLAQTADFEGLLSQPDTNWHGDTPGLSYFQSGAFKFANSYDTSSWGDYWSGAAYANIASGEYIDSLGYGNEFKNVAGGGAEGSASYGVLYESAQIFYTGDTLQGVTLSGCYMTNSVMLYNSVMNGDPFAGEPFKTGDFFKALIAGISPQGDTARMEFYLADYRDTDTTKHYALTTWEWVDLSGLGNIKRLLISFEGSRVGQYGQNLPLYAAIDNLSVKQETGVEELPSVLCRLYPVPAKDVLHVETQQGNCRAEIFSVQGRKMAEYRLAGTHSTLSLQGLVPGMYLLRLTCGTQVSTSRFVVGR